MYAQAARQDSSASKKVRGARWHSVSQDGQRTRTAAVARGQRRRNPERRPPRGPSGDAEQLAQGSLAIRGSRDVRANEAVDAVLSNLSNKESWEASETEPCGIPPSGQRPVRTN